MAYMEIEEMLIALKNWLTAKLDLIWSVIPTQASSANKLADRNFVNSSIATATATHRGNYNLVSDLSLTTAATEVQIATALASKMSAQGLSPDNNDYAYVTVPTADATPTEIARIDRYKYNGTVWSLEYPLNNSGFASDQWAAINSDITSDLVRKLVALPTDSELAELFGGKEDADNKTTVIDSSSTDQQYPSARAVYQQVKALQDVVADIETIAEGYVRVAGSSSPALSFKSYKYHEQGGFGRESAFSLFFPCLVGTKLTGDDAQVGKILHVLQKLDWSHDIEGNVRTLDGSEGDVMVVNLDPYFRIMGRHTIDGTEYDVFLMSRSPFTWQGIEAEEVARYGTAPDYCVSHLDADNVQRMHSVYNTAWNGSYSAPVGVVGKYVYDVDAETGDITETYDENTTLLGGAGGLHTTDKALYTGEQEAMNQNPDTTKCVPFMNQTAEICNNMQALLLSEGGTFDAHKAALMGSGFSCNDSASAAADWEESGAGAKNGCRVMDKDGIWKYYSLGSNVRFLFGEATGTRYAANCINSWRNPWHVMEAQRAVCHAISNGVHELEWFVFENNKYKYRSVEGFLGPAQGEMTCVVWKVMATKAGANAVDPTDLSTSIAGNRVEFLVSTALLHGVTTQVSPSWWVSGLIFTEDENGAYKAYMERDQASLIKSETGEKLISDTYNFETLYPQIGEVLTKGSGYAKNYLNGALMMPDTNANKTGGGLHTYVGKYNYLDGEVAGAGKKLVRGFRRGNSALGSTLSPLYVVANSAPSYAYAKVGFGTCVRIID